MRVFLSLLAGFAFFTAAGQTAGPISLTTSTGTLKGTLQLPAAARKVPVVLIIPGSGPTDRDGNNMSVVSNALKGLADSLQRRGIATLRYDKRGIGESQKAMPSEVNLRFDAYVQDVIDWIRLLRKDKRFDRIVVLGHDEGALIGMLATAREKAGGFVAVSAPALPADELLIAQLRAEHVMAPALIDSCRMMLDLLKSGQAIDSVPRHLKALFRPGIQPYLLSWIKYDPRLELPKVMIPTLLIQGTTDLEVPMAQAELLAGTKPDARLVRIEGMNHVFRNAPADAAKNKATYGQPDLPIDGQLVQTVADFVRSVK